MGGGGTRGCSATGARQLWQLPPAAEISRGRLTGRSERDSALYRGLLGTAQTRNASTLTRELQSRARRHAGDPRACLQVREWWCRHSSGGRGCRRAAGAAALMEDRRRFFGSPRHSQKTSSRRSPAHRRPGRRKSFCDKQRRSRAPPVKRREGFNVVGAAAGTKTSTGAQPPSDA